MSQYERYGMSKPPEPVGQAGAYEEELAQWLLEVSFFRDFVYRNPPSKGGRGELADAVVLYDDLVLATQVGSHHSARPVADWVPKTLETKLNQLRHTVRMLRDKHVRTLTNSTYGQVSINPSDIKDWIGLIVLDHEGAPYLPETA